MGKPWSDPTSDPLADIREVAERMKTDSLLPCPPNPVVTWAERPIVVDPDGLCRGLDGERAPLRPAHVFRPDNPTGLPVCIHCHGRKF